MNKQDLAAELFSQGFNCSQSVCSVFCEEAGLDADMGLKISCGFGGGMRQGEVCGAVTGAIMILGLKYGQYRADDKKSKEITYRYVNEFVERFKVKNETIICRDLLKCDISTEEGYRKIIEEGLSKKVCTKLIKDAISILEEILE